MVAAMTADTSSVVNLTTTAVNAASTSTAQLDPTAVKPRVKKSLDADRIMAATMTADTSSVVNLTSPAANAASTSTAQVDLTAV
ncbi:hypothetical protein EJD97_016414, partial [Solanum chilense]